MCRFALVRSCNHDAAPAGTKPDEEREAVAGDDVRDGHVEVTVPEHTRKAARHAPPNRARVHKVHATSLRSGSSVSSRRWVAEEYRGC